MQQLFAFKYCVLCTTDFLNAPQDHKKTFLEGTSKISRDVTNWTCELVGYGCQSKFLIFLRSFEMW